MQLWSDSRIVSIHGPMVARIPFGRAVDVERLTSLLCGGQWEMPEGLSCVVAGHVEGYLIGGNLCVLAHMAGALSPRAFEDCILFLEDVGEAPYRVDRCLTQLRRAGFLDPLRAVVLGDFTRCDAGSDGVSINDVLTDHLAGRGIPVVSGYPAAHDGRNWPFFHGAKVELCVEASGAVALQLSQ